MDHIQTQPIACQTTMKLLGDYWTLRIIDCLKHKELRFCELQRQLDGLNPVTLTNRLKKLETAELVIRRDSAEDKLAISYSLSTLGQQALPVMQALDEFATKLK